MEYTQETLWPVNRDVATTAQNWCIGFCKEEETTLCFIVRTDNLVQDNKQKTILSNIKNSI